MAITIDNLVTFFLSFNHVEVALPVIVLGYIWLDKDIFFHAICLIALSMMSNFILKSIFQVPLAPHIGHEGYAFPSGHMQFAVVLYGWLAYRFRNFYFRAAIVIILIGIGFSLVYRQYHLPYDVMGAVVSGSLLLMIYRFFLANSGKYFHISLIIIASCAVAYIYATQGKILPYIWMAYYFLVTATIADKILAPFLLPLSVREKIAATTIIVLVGLAIFVIFKNPILANNGPYIYQLKWLLTAFAIPFSKYCAPIFAPLQPNDYYIGKNI